MSSTIGQIDPAGAKPARGRPPRLAGAPPGPRQHDLRRGALLDAAAALFVEQGLGGTSIDHIVVRAGVAKGTFYHYFQDRAAMLEALRKRYSQQFADIASAAIDAGSVRGHTGRLEAWIDAIVQEYLATYALHDALFHDADICHRCSMGEEPFIQVLATVLADGEGAGEWDVGDPVMTAVCMFHGMHGLVDEAIASGSDTAAIAPYLSRLYARMIRKG